MPTIAQLNGGVGAAAVTDDDKFVGLDGATSITFLATVAKTYFVAEVTADISSLQSASSLMVSDIAVNAAAIATLNTTVTNLAISTSNTQTASYTFVLADGAIPFRTVAMNVATANLLTIPPNASVAFPIGTVLAGEQWGIGTTTWTPGSGVTIRSRGGLLNMAGQWAAASARKIATNEWLLSGDLS